MIYYTSSTGTIIGGTSATSQSQLSGISHIPSGADYAIYVDDTTVTNLNPNNNAGTYSFTNVVASITNGNGINTATGTLVFTELSAAQQLADAQTAQINKIKSGLVATLAGGFTAKTLVGSATAGHKYPTDSAAQSNFSGAISAFTANASKTTVTVETLDAGWINHTKAEFFGIYTDGDNWKEAQYNQLNTLIANVQTATTISAVQAIVWSEATY